MEKLEQIVEEVKGDAIENGLRSLWQICTQENTDDFAPEDLKSVKIWSQETILDAFQVHDLEIPQHISDAMEKQYQKQQIIPNVIQTLYQETKKNIRQAIQNSSTISRDTLLSIQELIDTDTLGADFFELANIIICHPSMDKMTKVFEKKICSNLDKIEMDAKCRLWIQFPHLWQQQVLISFIKVCFYALKVISLSADSRLDNQCPCRTFKPYS